MKFSSSKVEKFCSPPFDTHKKWVMSIITHEKRKVKRTAFKVIYQINKCLTLCTFEKLTQTDAKQREET